MPKNRVLPLVVIALCWGWTLLPASAAGLSFSSETILRAFEQNNERQKHRLVLPFYEYLGLDYGDSEAGGVSVHIYGWGRTDLADSAFFEDDPDGELIYGYIDYRKPYDPLSGRIGRQHIFAGVTNESIDGLSLAHGWGDLFSFTLFGGLPAAYGESHGVNGDLTYGGRIGCLFSPRLDVGISYQKLEDDGVSAQEKGGLDFNVHRGGWLSLSGLSGYNIDSGQWREHRYDLQVIVDDFSIEPSYQYFQYKDYFGEGNAGNSIFRFLKQSDETLNIYGADLIYSAYGELRVGVRGRQYNYDLRDENARYIAGLLSLSTFDGSQLGAEVGRMDGETPDNFYDLLRCYIYWQNPLELQLLEYISADALFVFYDMPVYDKDASAQLTLGAGRKFLDDFLETNFSVIYSEDPYFENNLSGVATLQINY